jgi:hypothetical protein
VGKRPGGLDAWNARDCRVRSNVEKNLVTRQHARPAVIEAHLERLRCHKAPSPHDQLGAACFVVVQMQGNLAATMSRLRWRTLAMSVVTGPVTVPNCAV